MQLFITPSKNILLTAISLGSTMICLAIIIGLLQLREKVIFKKNSVRFNFKIIYFKFYENGRKRKEIRIAKISF